MNVNGNDGMEDLTGLPPGRYRVAVTDALCGVEQLEITLFQGLSGRDDDRIITERRNVSDCHEGSTNDGRIEIIEVLAVSPGYTISWSGPGVSGSTSPIINNLAPGDYTVTITTPDGCKLEKTITICCCGSGPKSEGKGGKCGNQEVIFPITIYQELLYSPDNQTSYNGEIQIRINGGTSDNVISWTGPGGFISTRSHIRNLGVGEYCVTVSEGCSQDQRCFELVDCSEKPLQLLASVNNSCRSLTGQDIDAGIIQLQAEGGWPPFEHRWNDNNTNPTRTGLPAGDYCVTVSDSKGCRPETACFTIGFNQMTPVAANDDRCGQAWFCNGLEYRPDFQPVATYWEYDDFSDCRVSHEYCPFNNPDRRLPTPPRTDPLSNLRWDERSCDIIGDCPDGRGTQVAADGEQRRFFTVFLVDDPKCPGNAQCPACFEADFCEAFLNGERFIRPLDTEWTSANEQAGSQSFPGICGNACVLTCFGEAATRPDLSGDFCVQCPTPTKTSNSFDEVPNLVSRELSVVDYIIMDYQQGNDVFNTTYTFPGHSTLTSKLSSLPLWENRDNIETIIQGFTLNDLISASDEKRDVDFEDRDWRELELTNFSPIISPNPTNGLINIVTNKSYNTPNENVSMVVFTLDGKSIYSRELQLSNEPIQVDLSHLNSGVFIVRLVHPTFGQSTKRITIIK
jgi:hypothetical protein